MQLSPARLTRKSFQYLARNYRYAKTDPQFFFMKTVARFEGARELAKRISSLPPAPSFPAPAKPAAIHSEHDIPTALSTLESEGYYVGLRLAPDVLRALLDYARNQPCYADRNPALPFNIADRASKERELGRSFKLGSYLDHHEQWPVFQSLLNDPTVIELARGYLGADPTFLRSEICWSFPCESSDADRLANAQVFHCDINGFRTLKFFFYLVDVGEEDGPHTYIKKTPGKRTLLHQLLGQRCAAVPDEILVQTYGQDRVVTVTGPAGLGFAGDPYYFHRGTTPSAGNRLLLQLELGYRRYKTRYW